VLKNVFLTSNTDTQIANAIAANGGSMYNYTDPFREMVTIKRGTPRLQFATGSDEANFSKQVYSSKRIFCILVNYFLLLSFTT